MNSVDIVVLFGRIALAIPVYRLAMSVRPSVRPSVNIWLSFWLKQNQHLVKFLVEAKSQRWIEVHS